MMTTKQVIEKLGVNEKYIRKYKGNFRYHRSYFYRHGMSPESLVEFIKSKIPTATIVESGDHYHSFVGGAESGSAKDSFMWVTFNA